MSLGAANSTYALTTNLYLNTTLPPQSGNTACFNLTAPNVTLNCQGYTLTGNNTDLWYGVYSNSSNTTVENCNFSNFSASIWMQQTNYSMIYNNTLSVPMNKTANTLDWEGITLNSSWFGNVSRNVVSNDSANFTNSIYADYPAAIRLYSSFSNLVAWNNMTLYGINIAGIISNNQLLGPQNNITFNNINGTGLTDWGILEFGNSPLTILSNNITIYNAANGATGLWLNGAYNLVSFNYINVSCISTYCTGISTEYNSGGNNFTFNNITAYYGFGIEDSSFAGGWDNISFNNMIGNGAIQLSGTENAIIGFNNFTAPDTNDQAVMCSESNNASFQGNNITVSASNTNGVWLEASCQNATFNSNYIFSANGDAVHIGEVNSENQYANNSAVFNGDTIVCPSGCTNAFFVNQSSNVTLVNVTFNFSKLSVSGARYKRDGNNLPSWANVSWYIQANVSNSTGAVANSYVNFTNVTSTSPLFSNVLTNAQGSYPLADGDPVLRQPVLQPKLRALDRFCQFQQRGDLLGPDNRMVPR